ncbi:MAG: hypothetical protein ACR2QY_10505 [Akkermansiaceae bacterium]
MKELIVLVVLNAAWAHIALLLQAIDVSLIFALILAVGIIWGIRELRN